MNRRTEIPERTRTDLQERTRVLRRLRQHAAALGFSLINLETGEILEPGIS